jgi:hypothetical protein
MQGWATKEDVMTSAQVFVGIDVSKAQLDIALRPEGRLNSHGFPKRLRHLPCHARLKKQPFSSRWRKSPLHF